MPLVSPDTTLSLRACTWFMSMPTAPSPIVTPHSLTFCTTLSACACSSSALVGMQPQIRHVPPSAFCLLDDGHLQTQLRRANRGDVAARSRADHNHIELARHVISIGSYTRPELGNLLEPPWVSSKRKRDTISIALHMNPKPKTVLIVDDDEGMRDTLNAILRRDYRVLRAATGEAALAILNREDVDLMLLDVRLPGIGGFDVLRIVKENYSLVEVIMISAITEIETAVQAMKFGAYHYTTKDFEYETIRSLVHNASERQDLNRQVMTLSAQVADQGDREFVVGPSKLTRDIVDLVQKVAKLSATVLVLGESGTGKELLARLIHRESGNSRRTVHRRQPGRDSPRARREHAVRPRARIVHRRTEAAARQVRAGVGRHPVSRRDRRPAARAAGEAAARDSGRRNRAGRRRQADQNRLPPDCGDERRPRKGRQGRAFPRGPVLSHQRHSHQAAAAARSDRRPARAGAVLPEPLQGALQEAHPGHLGLDGEDSVKLLVARKHPGARKPDRAAGRRERQGMDHRRGPAVRVPLRAARPGAKPAARASFRKRRTPSSGISFCGRSRNRVGTSRPRRGISEFH